MNETEKHALRCETCDYYRLHPEIDECMICTHPKFKDDIFMHDITGVEFDRIEKMGCASHSKACEISNANILGEERNKVLEKMISILAAHTLYSDNFEKDKIKGGWILVGGYEPIVEDIELLAGKTKED